MLVDSRSRRGTCLGTTILQSSTRRITQTKLSYLFVGRKEEEVLFCSMLHIDEDSKSVSLDGNVLFTDVFGDTVNDAILMGGVILICAHGRKVSVIQEGNETWSVEAKKRVVLLARMDVDTALYVDAGGLVRALNVRTRESRELFAHFAPITAVAVVNDCYIVTADADMQVRVSRLDLPREIVFFLLGHETPVVAFTLPTRAVERHILGSVSTLGVVLWHSLENGQRVEHPFARIEPRIYQRVTGHGHATTTATTAANI